MLWSRPAIEGKGLAGERPREEAKRQVRHFTNLHLILESAVERQ